MAEILLRLGLRQLHIWDDDIVSEHNLGNQVYRNNDVHKPKTTALKDLLLEINPEAEIIEHGRCELNSKISGYIFLTVDNIDTRRELCTKWLTNGKIIYITDGRMRLTDGTIYAADWTSMEEPNILLKSMQYSHEEALANTPVSACGLTLSVVCTPRVLASFMVTNWLSFLKDKKYNRLIQIDTYNFFIDHYEAK